MTFSVIMSVYGGCISEHFHEAINSVLNQVLPPDELLIVVDGPVNEELETAIKAVSVLDSVRILRTPSNNGAGAARHYAISEARFEIIAIMDADDICLPDRFSRQIPILESGKADVVGAWVEEFDNHPGDLGRVRRVPVMHEEIFEYGKWRQPLNHVTAVFRKETYRQAGAYRSLRHVEDWDLLTRMLEKGAKFYNIPEVLVHVRCGKSMLRRRSGLPYLFAELRLFRRMYFAGYLNTFQLLLNVLVRLVSRLLPNRLLGIIYEKWLRYGSQALTR